MKPSLLSTRTLSKLSDSIYHQVSMYALAASAAGVGMLATGQSAEARMVYTPAHKVVGPKHHYNLNLNHDKVIDFNISNSYACGQDWCADHLSATRPMGTELQAQQDSDCRMPPPSEPGH
jgi:hypothetical protein